MIRCARPGPERTLAVDPRPATTVKVDRVVFGRVVREPDATLRVVVVVGLAWAAVVVGAGRGRAAAAPIPRADTATTAATPAKIRWGVIQFSSNSKPPATSTVPGGQPH